VRARFLARFSSTAPFFFAALNEFGHKEKWKYNAPYQRSGESLVGWLYYVRIEEKRKFQNENAKCLLCVYAG
jgi:hypothetical protein